MKVTIVITEQSHVANFVGAFGRGIERHGNSVEAVYKGKRAYKRGELAVCWGERTRRQIKQYYDHVIVLENGYWPQDRSPEGLTWISAGYNGLNGNADFCNENSPPDRWEQISKAYGIECKEWRDNKGEYILLLGQVPGDAAHSHIDIDNWYDASIRMMKRNHGLPVVFRPHPKALNVSCPQADYIDTTSDLHYLLDHCAWSVSLNSTAGVESILNGTRHAVGDKGSMVWSVAGSHPAWVPPRVDRQQWLNNMAYTSWTRAELQNGDAWDHLSGGIW